MLVSVPASDAGYQVGERLPLVKQPVLIIRARDDFWESTARTESLLREARRVDLPNHGSDLLDAGALEVARLARDFLDR